MQTFVFSGVSFSIRPYDTLGSVFTFSTPVVSVYFPQSPQILDTPKVFEFGCYDSPQDSYRFTQSDYSIYRDDYIPSSAFSIPNPCYYGQVDPPAPPLEGIGLLTMSDLYGAGSGLILEAVNRLMVREPVCVDSENASLTDKLTTEVVHQKADVLNILFEMDQGNSDQIDAGVCHASETPIHIYVSSEIAGTNSEVVSIITYCSLFENGIPVNTQYCATVDAAIFIVVPETVSERQQAIPTNGFDVVVPLRDMTDVQFIEKQDIYPISGEPYEPLPDFAITPYSENTEVVQGLCTYEFANYQLTFKIGSVGDDAVFRMQNYDVDTFFTPILFYPASTICDVTVGLGRRYQWLFIDAVRVILNQGLPPLRDFRCSRSDNALVTYIPTCSVQENAEDLPPGTSPWIDPDVDIPIEPPGGGEETFVVPIQEVYTMQNIISATLDDGTTPVSLSNLSLGFDVDGHSWTWSGELLSINQLALLTPAANGVPVLIYVTVNGTTWHLTVERTITNRTFGSKVVQLSGRGLSALLAEPYQVAESSQITSLLTNQQIAESFIPIGWTIVWELAVWNVPADTYSHLDKSPIDALLDFAKQCGGILVPSLDSQTITVRKRYPVLPWHFAAATPDILIPDSVIVGLTEEPVAEYGANGVYIHGFEGGGSQALCRITGTDGARLATTTASNLMVDAVAIRALGERVLAGEYVQPKIRSITTFMDDGSVMPLVEGGTFVEFTVDAVQDRGIVNSVNISATFSEKDGLVVTQAMTIGESTSNVYSLFKELIPAERLDIVTLVSTDGTTSIVLLMDNTSMRVRGTGTVSNKYYIKGGAIDGDAPSVTILPEIVV